MDLFCFCSVSSLLQLSMHLGFFFRSFILSCNDLTTVLDTPLSRHSGSIASYSSFDPNKVKGVYLVVLYLVTMFTSLVVGKSKFYVETASLKLN